MKLKAFCAAVLAVAAPALAEGWGKGVYVNRGGEARPVPETANQNGVKYEQLNAEEQDTFAIFAKEIRGVVGGQSKLPTDARIKIVTGDFPSPTANGYVHYSSLLVGDLKSILAKCDFGPIISLGRKGSTTYAMTEFRCPNQTAEWKNGAVGFTLGDNKVDFVVNNGDLTNYYYRDAESVAK